MRGPFHSAFGGGVGVRRGGEEPVRPIAASLKLAPDHVDTIDQSGGFYKGHADVKDRSMMNVTFNLATPELEKDFVEKAKKNDFIGVKGHRLVGGLRISLYNAVTPEAAKALADFMKEYKRTNG